MSSMSNSVETKLTGCALNLSARPACNTSDVLLCVSLRSRPSPSVPPVWRPVSASAPPVKGVLVLLRRTRKRFFQVFMLFLRKSVLSFKNSYLIGHFFLALNAFRFFDRMESRWPGDSKPPHIGLPTGLSPRDRQIRASHLGESAPIHLDSATRPDLPVSWG